MRRPRLPIDENKRGLAQVAVEDDNRDLLDLLLKYQVDLFVNDANGLTAFSSACALGRAHCLRMMIRHCGIPREGCLAIAAKNGRVGCVALLLAHGSNPEELEGVDVNPDIARLASIARESGTGKIYLIIRWEILRRISRNPKTDLARATNLPGDTWDHIVSYMY